MEPSARRAVPEPRHPATREAGLRYLLDDQPGIRRLRTRHGFRYVGPKGKPVNDPRTLSRIRSLAVPPAWTQVWICTEPTGHLQATGRDARGRKQYRYHPRWREVRDDNKFNRMIAFGKALPAIRRRVRHDIRQPGLGRSKVVASVVRLLELTAARIGNPEYASENRSYGLTTLRDHHVQVEKTRLRLRYRGKAGKEHRVDFQHPRLARIVQRCRDLPGMHLFQYIDDKGTAHNVTSSDVNEYLAQAGGGSFSAKDFRTWTGTVVAAMALCETGAANPGSRANRRIKHAIEQVARRLGNTVAICRKCYVHPAILDAYREGSLLQTIRRRIRSPGQPNPVALRPEERGILLVMRNHAKRTEADRLAGMLQGSLDALRANAKPNRRNLHNATGRNGVGCMVHKGKHGGQLAVDYIGEMTLAL